MKEELLQAFENKLDGISDFLTALGTDGVSQIVFGWLDDEMLANSSTAKKVLCTWGADIVESDPAERGNAESKSELNVDIPIHLWSDDVQNLNAAEDALTDHFKIIANTKMTTTSYVVNSMSVSGSVSLYETARQWWHRIVTIRCTDIFAK